MNYFYGLLNLNFWQYVIVTLVMMHITIISVTLYLHRCQAHRSIDLHPIISHFFRFWLWLTTGQVTKAWAAIHRKHHAKCETAEDPHSPQIEGIKTLLLEGAELYKKECKNQETLDKYGAGTPDDWLERHVYSGHSAMGILVLFIADILLFGVPGITIWAIQMMTIPLFAAGVINGIGHYWGYRNFAVEDASTNITPIAFLLGGEELHNNHHAFSTSAKFSSKWFEFDLGWLYIRLFSLLGLAKVKRVQSELEVCPSKTATEHLQNMRSILQNRVHVVTGYTKEVIFKVLADERQKASKQERKLFARAKSLLVRDPALVKVSSRERLGKLLNRFSNLKKVYQYREKLAELWNPQIANRGDFKASFLAWCKQAEESGIDALAQFAKRILPATAE